MKLNIFTKFIVLMFFTILLEGCAQVLENQNALPESWYKMPERGEESNFSFEEPSAKMNEYVKNTFSTHVTALTDLEEESTSSESSILSVKHPKNWTPWHLDGMIVSFAIDENGLFGFLAFNNTTSIKGTWQQIKVPVPPVKNQSQRKSAIKLNRTMTDTEVVGSLEPTIQTIMATKVIKNETFFRKTLAAQVLQFVSVGRELDRIQSLQGWHVDSYELQLTFNAQGQITPLIGVGGVVNIFFDWQKLYGNPKTMNSAPSNPILFQSLQNLTQVVASLIPEAIQESEDLRSSGFDLNQFQVGVALGAGWTIGIAQAGAAICGKIIYNKNYQELKTLMAMDDVPSNREDATINLVTAENHSTIFTRSYGSVTSKGNPLIKIPRSKFKEGIKRAIKMGSYFSKRAKEADSKTWNVTNIEAEFDATIGGDLKIATVNGQGQMVLDFNRIAL
ncbi:MAG: hypothetical protein ACXVB4_16395 [Pseudobdellovibrionaceae bacterium]